MTDGRDLVDIVAIHGAFRGRWAWDRVRALVEPSGHRFLTPDLTDPTATLDSYLDQVVSLFDEHDITSALLVGHSQGGFVARAASNLLAEHLTGVLYLDAPVPEHGERAFDFRPPGTEPPPVQRDDVIDPRPVEADDHLPDADARWINARLVAQPVAPSMDPVTLTDPTALNLPQHHVFFTHTPTGFPCAVTRQRLDAAGGDYRLIDAPHDGIVTHPAEVAALIIELARR